MEGIFYGLEEEKSGWGLALNEGSPGLNLLQPLPQFWTTGSSKTRWSKNWNKTQTLEQSWKDGGKGRDFISPTSHPDT